MYSEPTMFSSIIFYNGPCIILKHVIVCNMYVCMYPFSLHNGITTVNVHI
jgi:hypothetical protein